MNLPPAPASTSGTLQRTATVSTPGDACEHEADAVAEQVLGMAQPPPIASVTHTPVIARRCERCEEEDDVIQAAAAPAADTAGALDTSGAVRATQGGSEPLSGATRAFFEPRFGRDFGAVRVHDGASAAAAARSVHARAYTLGQHIVFGAGEFAPATARGRRLLAHELTHVVQQRGAGAPRPEIQRAVSPDFEVNEAQAGSLAPGFPARVFFARGSAVIDPSQSATIDAFKSGPARSTVLTLLGLATEDEIAANPSLPADRANAVDAALATALPGPPPFSTAHAAARTVTPGTLANTAQRPNLRFNRAVEILQPGEPSLSPATPIAAPTACNAAIETAFQAAKVMAFDWIDTTLPELSVRPLAAGLPVVAGLDRFFGNHLPATARRVKHNLGLIRAEIASIARPTHHDCADPNLPGCVSALAFNSGGAMTICSGYMTRSLEDRARNLVHEAGHSTAGLRITGLRNAARTSDFSYRRERMIGHLGSVNPDQALANSDSYSMLLMTLRAAAAVTPGLVPPADPAATGFARPSDADKANRAVAFAQIWLRLAGQGLTDLHGALRSVGVGNALPATLGDPRRLDRIFSQVKLGFPPILAGPSLSSDDLLMIAGVLDRYREIEALMGQPIAVSFGAATRASLAPPLPLALEVDAAFLAANERARARSVVDRLIELIPLARISAALRPSYGQFAEFVRNLHQ